MVAVMLMKRSELKSRRIRIEVLSDCYLSTGAREKGWGGVGGSL